jgi:phage terminase large subunit
MKTDIQLPLWAQFLTKPMRYKCAWGGRGSGKSWAFAMMLLIEGAKSQQRVLCAREIQKSLKDSVHQLLTDQIVNMGLQDFYEVTESEIRGKNGTLFLFAGLKNNSVATIKSFEGVTRCWVEEAQSVSKRSWDILIPTIRAPGSEIWVTFNPELETDETYQRFVLKPPENCVSVKVNWNLNPWFPETLRIEKDSLKSRDMSAYNVVWEGLCRQTVDGAIFAKEMQMAELEGRLTRVPYDPSKPVHAIFDLGWADATAIWFLQFIGMETRLIRYIEGTQQTMSEYLAKMQTFGYIYDTLWLPHDAENKTLAANGRSIEEIVRNAGYKTRIIPRTPVADSINAARTLFRSCYFDRELCHEGLQCLRHYRYEVDPDTGQFSRTPLHDHYSHGADAFRMIGLMVNEPRKTRPARPVVHNYLGAQGWMS